MKKWFIALLLMYSTSTAQAYTAKAGITGTPHDFTGSQYSNNQDIGLCTFCHTPHRAYMTKLLWNHTLSANTGFTWQDVTATTAGTTFATIANNQNNPSATWMGPTTRCLSCHDGSVAIGDIAWFNSDPHGKNGGTPINTFNVGGDFGIGMGGNMSGNHPVAMPFPFNQTPSTYNGVTTGGSAYLDEWVSDPTLGNVGGNETFIRLFKQVGTNDVAAGTEVGKTGIECSSCHDPHNKKTASYKVGSTEARYYLRGSLTGSDKASGYICLQCHIK